VERKESILSVTNITAYHNPRKEAAFCSSRFRTPPRAIASSGLLVLADRCRCACLQEDKNDGTELQAIFKPRTEGDFDGWHRVPIERVAYILNTMLGLDYVPPTAYRYDIHVDGKTFEQGGAVMHFVDNLRELSTVQEDKWGVSKAGFLGDTRILVRGLCPSEVTGDVKANVECCAASRWHQRVQREAEGVLNAVSR
jgi:hypothetical protein